MEISVTIDINSLTLGQIQQLAGIAASLGSCAAPAATETLHPMIGQYCLVRGRNCGVFAGTVAEVTANRIVLHGARRLWRWHSAKGIDLDSVGLNGIVASKSKICPLVDVKPLERSDVCEFVQCSPKARKSIEDASDADAS
jgi:hypothetical protein